MIALGLKQKLIINRKSEIGVYLTDDKNSQEVLLPKKQVPSDIAEGDEIEVFIYKDSKDRIIATTNEPKIFLKEIKVLKVVEVTPIGAFLDWGLEKDLLLPFKEQTVKVKEGKEYPVALYIDKSDRLCATMDLYKYLESQSPYDKDDAIKGNIYDIKESFGAFVAIDLKYQGLIQKNELINLKVGDEVEGRVTEVREDGKLNISLREKAYLQMDDDADMIIKKLEANGGQLNLSDNSPPEEIKLQLNISKKAYKRAVGRLLKNEKIKITEKGIELK
ncbi:hypothetical protein EDC18_103154 [Natranaerovirga pectinivora]|uniref:S1 motif domain-containing protein n=1 Tax=Natranaerovirga pectinivora TaxID=682400 RepID=A0A4R3MPC3_9FIRM|nr:S1-like domain-containing RNA-binding protein [Natranaerovirga pectinivora]TCT15449.1 hypothetical protein EDC18_103154 [Natranaerovirga pectinivora]